MLKLSLKSCFSAFLLTAFGYNNLKRFFIAEHRPCLVLLI
ncbi:hypothetical protein ACIRA0001_1699 [Acinetobacter radioresistens SK82]|uniref:Uncharacterized protein n=1 Tax=Acinetobacter radioresistens SK82 TaxID=596318 RepID=A0ABM9YPJ2_ACIRA|nr:hypothetical protein ACIRA0001_1699 [Acinetobacter radioresistens SK82]